MKRITTSLIVTLSAVLLLTACKKEENEAQPIQQNEVSQDVLSQIKALGFGTSSVQKVEDGYLVEGDIVLTKEQLDSKPAQQILRVGEEEQYRTFNTVSVSGSRNITVSVSSSLPASVSNAVNDAIARYNAENLTLTFSRVTEPSSGHCMRTC